MLEILPYTDNDTEACVPLMTDLGYPTTLGKLKERMSRIHAEPNTFTYLLKYEQQIIGMAGFKVFYYYESDNPAGQITLLVIKKEYQSRGYGLKLLTFVEHYMKQLGVTHITLNSGIRKEREHAHYFYQKHRYNQSGIRFSKQISHE